MNQLKFSKFFLENSFKRLKGHGFGGKSYDKIRYGSCSCTNPETCKWTLDMQPCQDIDECEVKF